MLEKTDVVVVAIGSRGDVQPYVALCTALALVRTEEV